MDVESLTASGPTPLPTRLRHEHRVRDVFSAVLEEAGRQGYASAEAVTEEVPLAEQVTASWSEWFDGEVQWGRYATAAQADVLKSTFGKILVRAYEDGGYAAPKEYLATLTETELEVVQDVHSLADGIQVDSLTEEGAMNLLLPPAARIDLNHDGFVQRGAATGFWFPDSSTPPDVAKAWEETTAGMSWGEVSLHVMQIMLPLLTANIVQDANGQFVKMREPGDPDFVNPMASADYSYLKAAEDRLEYLDTFRSSIPDAQYERDKTFWTAFQERLEANGVK